MSAVFDCPSALREAARVGRFDKPTSGHAPGYLQANLMIVPRERAFDFLLFCQRNPKPCPLIEVMEPGMREPRCAPGANIATDVPGYRVYENGELVAELADVSELWRDDFVTFVIGCSFSFEDAVIKSGVSLRHVEEGRNVAMYRTGIACQPAGDLHGDMVVSMRPIKCSDVPKVVEISSRFSIAHGSPVHVGNPAGIGIGDLAAPDYGDAVAVLPDELPVFWACGVTPQWVAQKSRLPFCITQAPGKMLVTDLKG